MQIQAIAPQVAANRKGILSYANNGIKNFGNSNLSAKQDVFEKQSSQISFTGTKKTKELDDSLLALGLVGGSVLVSMAMGIAMAQGQDVGEIIADEDGYEIDTNELSLKSDKVIADADDGIFKVEGTGIDINPSRFSDEGDIFDPANGIYKTADGTIDIDLLNNKYIDTENKIIVDPEQKISSFIDEDGEAKHFALPTFKGYQQEYAHLVAPNRNPDAEPIPTLEDGIIKSTIHTIKTSPLFSDLFGRKITTAVDDDGHEYPTPIPANMPSAFGNLDPNSKIVVDSAEELNDSNLRTYIKNNFPSMEAFMASTDINNHGNADDPLFLSDDSDNSGVDDLLEVDLDDNGTPDYIDKGLTAQEAYADENDNDIPDFLEGDADDNGVPDFMQIDNNVNGIPDYLEGDLNHNGIPDYQDEDTDGNGIPDFLENK